MIELYAHDRIAGRISESEIAGGRFLRVEIPGIANGTVPEENFVRFFSVGAIFSITPLGEELCRSVAKELGAPNLPFDIQHITNRLVPPVIRSTPAGGLY